MPSKAILDALNMTPEEWGKIPPDGDARTRLRKEALEIISNGGKPLNVNESVVRREKAIIQAEESDRLSRSGFESAMVQQATMFGEAVKQLRERQNELEKRLQAIEERTTNVGE